MRFNLNHPRFFFCFLLCAAVVYLYSFSLGHNFLFDEDDIILKNPVIRDLSRLPDLLRSGYFQKMPGVGENWEQYYRPLPLLTFMVDFQFWKTNPLGYNLTNLVLQCGVAILLYLLLFKLFPQEPITAFLAALLYLVHPIHTEAVTYIASRGDVLAALFMLGAMHLYWKRRIAAAVLCYILSLFSKESALLLPLYLIFLERALIRRKNFKEAVGPLLCFFLVGVLYVLFRKTLCPIPMGPPTFSPERAFFRLFSMGQPFLNYWAAILVPEPFKYCEQIDFATTLSDHRVWQSLLVFTGVAGLWFMTFRRWKSASEHRRLAFFGMTWFLLALGPSLQIIHYFPEWAEHYLYFASMGLTILAAVGISKILKLPFRRFGVYFLIVYIAVILFWSARTVQRNIYYCDTRQYYEKLSESDSPYAYYGYINLALMDIMEKSWDAAFVRLRTAYLINPKSETNNYNLGLYYMIKEKYGTAYDYFRGAFESPTGNHQPMHQLRMAQAQVLMGNFQKAIEIYLEVKKNMPESGLVYKHLSRAYVMARQPEMAKQCLEEGLATVDKKTLDHASLLMEKMILGYLYDWKDAQKEAVEDLMHKPNLGGEEDWYRASAKALSGQMSVGDYKALVTRQYPYNENSAFYVVLMAESLQGRWTDLGELLMNKKKTISAESKDPLFTQMIFDRAERMLHENTKNI